MTIRCHFDGKVFVPDEPIDLPVNEPLLVRIDRGVVIVQPPEGKGTVGDMLKHVGIWKDRTDIVDSTEFVRKLRLRAQHQDGE